MACFGHRSRRSPSRWTGRGPNGVRAVARETGLVVVAGMFTPAPDGRVTNTLLATGPGVEAVVRQDPSVRRLRLRRVRHRRPGLRVVTIDVDGVRVGLATCYDVRFPELFRAHADAGAVLSLLPASWGAGPGKRDQWELLTRARALDATRLARRRGPGRPGGAAAPRYRRRGPHRHRVQRPRRPRRDRTRPAGAAPGLLVADVDTEEVAAVRRTVPVLANRKLGTRA